MLLIDIQAKDLHKQFEFMTINVRRGGGKKMFTRQTFELQSRAESEPNHHV